MWCLDASLYLDGRGCKAFPVLQTLLHGNQFQTLNHRRWWGQEERWNQDDVLECHFIGNDILEMLSLTSGRPQTPPHYLDNKTRVCRWSCLQKCLLNGWKKGWAKTEGKRNCLSSEKGDSEEVDTASLFLSWAGDMGLAGKNGPELREKSQGCWREDRSVLLANSRRAAHESQSSTLF